MDIIENQNNEQNEKIRASLTRGELMKYDACFGICRICFNEGACNLQQKLKEIKEKT